MTRRPAPVLFIGQAPPRVVAERPFGRTHLYRWLASVGIDEAEAMQDFAFTALVSDFPGIRGGSHRPPSPAAIAAERPRLLALVRSLRPRVIVPVGVLSLREVLANPAAELSTSVGNEFARAPFGDASLPHTLIIPLPHPSGASTWIYQSGNQERLSRALRLLLRGVRNAQPL